MSKKQIYVEPSISLFEIYIERGFAQSDGLGWGSKGGIPKIMVALPNKNQSQ